MQQVQAGFEGGQPPRRQPGISRASDLRGSRPGPGTGNYGAAPEPERAPAPVHSAPSSQPAPRPSTQPVSRPPAPAADDDDLDVPDFLK
jgi:cell division protein FtsZ